MPRRLFAPGKDPVAIVQEAGWAPVPVWIGAENLAPTEIRCPDRLARSQSLYRLRYPAHTTGMNCPKIKMIVLSEGSQTALVCPAYKNGVTVITSFTCSEPFIVLYICEN